MSLSGLQQFPSLIRAQILPLGPSVSAAGILQLLFLSLGVVRLHVPRHTAALPLPAPFPGCFDGGGPMLSKKRLRILAQKRVVHVLVIVIDFLYLGRFASFEELGRHPTDIQLKCFRSLCSFVAACGRRSESFPIPPGRSGAELVASLDTLEHFLEETGMTGTGNSGYDAALRFASGSKKREVSIRQEHPVLRPYRSLDASRLRITGTGEWPLEDYLHGPLWLPFVEPAILRHGLDVDHFSCP